MRRSREARSTCLVRTAVRLGGRRESRTHRCRVRGEIGLGARGQVNVRAGSGGWLRLSCGLSGSNQQHKAGSVVMWRKTQRSPGLVPVINRSARVWSRVQNISGVRNREGQRPLTVAHDTRKDVFSLYRILHDRRHVYYAMPRCLGPSHPDTNARGVRR